MHSDSLSPADLSFSKRKQPPSIGPRAKRAICFALTFTISFLTWLLLSGRFDVFHLSLGVVASAIVASLSGTILLTRRQFQRLPGQWLRFAGYLPWLLYQIFAANLHVMYLVCHPRMFDLIEPRVIRFRSRLKRPMSLFIFANSITLTPGTITISVSITGEYTVHVIDEQSGTGLPGEMERRVAAVSGE